MSQFTLFAPPARDSAGQVEADHQRLIKTGLAKQLLDSFPEPAMVLNQSRQIVLANDKLAHLLHLDQEKMLGSRPGEALNCVHAWDSESGCGTSQACTLCGAVQAIWECSKTNTPQLRECRLTRRTCQGDVSLDLRVWATPLAQDGQFTVFAIRDTSDEKRRAVLERLFFHDVLNVAGGLRGLIELWPDLAPEKRLKVHQTAERLAEELIEEIESHRDLTAAERGDLAPAFREVDAEELITRLCVLYSNHHVAMGKDLAEPILSGTPKVVTDEAILSRVLGNLIKNALEASTAGQAVQVSYENSGVPVFSVHNESEMTPNVQLQVFQRSFSTKGGSGRGLGTYSVKLLTERYLKGSVGFTSSAAKGTTFTVTLSGN